VVLAVTVTSEAGALFLKGIGGEFEPLEPLSDTPFVFRQMCVPVVFARDSGGAVDRSLWGGFYQCKKIVCAAMCGSPKPGCWRRVTSWCSRARLAGKGVRRL
jgi:hypothetical protein